MDDHVIAVSGLPQTCNPMKMKLEFQRITKAKISCIKLTENEVHLDSSEDVDIFCSKFPFTVRFGGNNYEIKVVKSKEKENEQETEDEETRKVQSIRSRLEKEYCWNDLDEMPQVKCGLLIQTPKSISIEDIQKYFEGEQSCGGPITDIIKMMDGLLIVYENEQTTLRVWDFRPHRIHKKHVRVFIKKIPSPYDRTILLKPNSASYEVVDAKDDLDLSTEDASPMDIKKHSQFAIVARYSQSTDPKKIIEIVKDFESFNGKVRRLVRTDSIKVDGCPPDVSAEELTMFFENKIRSGGGPVTLVQNNKGSCALVYFASFEDVDTVVKKCKSQSVNIFGHSLNVSHCFHFGAMNGVEKDDQSSRTRPTVQNHKENPSYSAVAGRKVADKSGNIDAVAATSKSGRAENPSYSEVADKSGNVDDVAATSKPGRADEKLLLRFVYADVTTDLIDYLTKCPEHLNKLSSMLGSATVQPNESGLKVAISTVNHAGPKSRKASEKIIKTFLDGYRSQEIKDFDGSQILKVRQECLDYRFASSYSGNDKEVLVRWSGAHSTDLTCTGPTSKVNSFVRSLKETLDSKGKKMVLRPILFKWLSQFDFLKQFRKSRTPKITTDMARSELQFSGKESDIVDSQRKIIEELKNLKCCKYKPAIPEFMIYLMKSKTNRKIGDRIQTLLNSDIEHALFFVNGDDVEIWCKKTDELVVLSRLDNSLAHYVSVISAELGASGKSAWKSISKYVDEGQIEVLMEAVTEGSRMKIVGLKESVEKAKGLFKVLELGLNSETEKVVKISMAKGRYLLDRHPDFKRLCTVESVTVTRLDENGLTLKGCTKQVRKVEDQMKAWVDQIMEISHHLQMHGIVDFWNSEEASSMVEKIGAKYGTSILYGGSVIRPSTIGNSDYSLTNKGNERTRVGLSEGTIGFIKIAIREADITEEKTDAIVNCTGPNFDLTYGVLSSTISSKVGYDLQAKVDSAYGSGKQIRLTTGGQLPCKNILHVVKPVTQDDIQKCLFSILDQCYLRYYKTLSLPAIGIGTLGISSGQVAMLIMQAIEAYCKKNPFRWNPESISMIIHDKAILSDFQEALNVVTGNSGKPIITEPQKRSFAAVAKPAQDSLTTLKFGNLTVSVRTGDITSETNDAIVNSTGEDFDLSKGLVSQAIMRKGGYGIQSSVNALHWSDIRMTTAGRLPCKHIIHAVTPRYPDKLVALITKILHTADGNLCQSLSIPALGTGKLGMEAKHVAGIMVKAFQHFSNNVPANHSLRIVDIVIFDMAILGEFLDGFSTKESMPKYLLGQIQSALSTVNAWATSSPKAIASSMFQGEQNTVFSTAAGMPHHGKGADSDVDYERVELVFSCMFAEDIQNAWDEVQQAVKASFAITTIPFSGVERLQPTALGNIKSMGQKRNVLVQIEKDQIRLEGLKKHVSHVRNEIDTAYRIPRSRVAQI